MTKRQQSEREQYSGRRKKMTYELTGTPRIESEYSDQWETTMVCDVIREDLVRGDVWIVAGVPDYHRGSSEAARTQRGFRTVRVFGDSPDMWCPASLDYQDADEIIASVENAALATHRARINEISAAA